MNSARIFRSTSAFTLIELMVVIGLIAMMTAALIPSFSSYSKKQNLIQAQEQVRSDLISQQNRALTGTNSSAGTGDYWGIKFVSGDANYYMATTDTPATCPSTAGLKISTKLPGVITINTSRCVWFSKVNGDTYGGSDVTISVTDGSSTPCTITINAVGRVVADPC